ncbi:MAG: EutN/CcmL family microcompartment protein [Gemmatimonadota bacterium]|nr:EutN/CcmL family microcompartment protein [Gemmatimonadota bacterium]MDP6529977.1 EutN/CcmL family microcompartment protein [Gemmatimonadota bacterium]MDP6802118.1 EutN/CcmL family microcompartment protein [Gemmatimonadota bacterium]MDP7032053.1 EutN/CcmL family microcompartment protein [Gemmatimonadota bacterium]
MKLGQVIGSVWATAKEETLAGRKLLLVRPMDATGVLRGAAYLAVDTVDAGVGDEVLVLDEGNSAGQVLGLDQPPIRTVIVGVVDHHPWRVPEK